MTLNTSDRYLSKIKTKEELLKIIGKTPRTMSIIMCHGVFDVVHPGHIRHLTFAKSKADILIASLTCDAHITKGIYRPHVPEQIRAKTLAAFEMVDYVIIDINETPLNNISDINPDFFAKGFEYTDQKKNIATAEEQKVVESYGGKLIFTPGDIIYSSSKLIEMSPPKIEIEKLISLMELYNINFDDLRKVIKNIKNFSVHVVGDTIIDSYTRTSLIGGQTKTPTFSVLKEDEDKYIGGAGVVALHLAAAGADVTFSTVLGKDELKDFTINGLENANIKIHAIIDENRPTTNKNVFIAGGYRLLKVDTLDNSSISDDIVSQLKANISSIKSNAIVFSDFRHGIFNKKTIDTLTSSIPSKQFKVADSQVASRWGNITDFKNFDLITPNEKEARFAQADQDSTVGQLSTDIKKATNCGMLILKLGERGVFINRSLGDDELNYFSIGSFASHISDAVGAGDAMLAYSTLAMLETNSEVIAGILGSLAAACECEYDGNIPIGPEKIIAKIDQISHHIRYE